MADRDPFITAVESLTAQGSEPPAAPPENGRIDRRTVLGTAVGAGAVLAVGTGTAAAQSPVRPAAGRPGPTSDRHVMYRGFSGVALQSGRQHGTQWSRHGVRIGHATGRRSYADPFADEVARGLEATAVEYETATWTSPTVHVTFGCTELISSWEVETPGRTWVEVAVRGHDENGDLSGWYVLGRWCSKDPDDGGAIHRTSVDDQGTDLATVWTDTLHLYAPHRLTDWQLQVTLLRPTGSHDSPVIRTVGAMASRLPDSATVPVSSGGAAAGVVLDVPTLSQEVHEGHYPQWDGGGEAWCSATSSAMVVKYWQRGPSGPDLAWVDPPVDAEVDYTARNVFDYTYDGAGNWPFNTAYATTRGLQAIVTRLRSFTEAEELIRAGIPVIISVSFEKGDLDGAGYGTNGHLMVVVGFTADGDVVVNDPASHLQPDNDQVRFTYRRDQLENAWVPHSGGTAYLVHPAQVPLPQVLDRHEPNW